MLIRERRWSGAITMLLGATALIDATGVIVGSEPLATAGLMVYLFLAPIWAFGLGLELLRRPVQPTVSVSSDSRVPSRWPLPAETPRT